MRRIGLLSIVAAIAALVALCGFVQDTQITRPQLRSMLEQLGYEVKDLVKDAGKEKYTVTVTRGGLDIPIAYEISSNNGYIWLTVNLGDAPSESSSKNAALLRQNGKIQPCQFYVTEKGLLMMGFPVENKNVTNALLRQRTDTIADNVSKTEDIWKK